MKNNDKISTVSSSENENENIKKNKKKIKKNIKNVPKDNDFIKEVKVIGKKRKITFVTI